MSGIEPALVVAAALRLSHGDGALHEAQARLYKAGAVGDQTMVDVMAEVCDLLACEQGRRMMQADDGRRALTYAVTKLQRSGGRPTD